MEQTTPVLDVVRGFVEATRGRHFDLVWGLLSARWRSTSTVGSLTADFDAEPLALDRLRHIEEALSRPPVLDGGVAELVLETGGALVLVREDAGWRIDRLE